MREPRDLDQAKYKTRKAIQTDPKFDSLLKIVATILEEQKRNPFRLSSNITRLQSE